MLDKIIGFFVNNLTKDNSSSVQDAKKTEPPVPSIDYDLLATKISDNLCAKLVPQIEQSFINAQVKAHLQIKELEEKSVQDTTIQEQKEWRKTLRCENINPYEGYNPVKFLLNRIHLAVRGWWGIWCFERKDASRSIGLFGAMGLCATSLLGLYKWLFYAGAIYFSNCAKNYLINDKWLWLNLFACLCAFSFARFLRMLQLKLEECKDKDTIDKMANFIFNVTAVILAFIAIVSKGGS